MQRHTLIHSHEGDLARRLIAARTALHLSVDEVAQRAGIQANYLRYLESTANLASDACLRSLATALRTSKEELLGGSSPGV